MRFSISATLVVLAALLVGPAEIAQHRGAVADASERAVERGDAGVPLAEPELGATLERLRGSDIDQVFRVGLHEFLRDFIAENNRLGFAVAKQFLFQDAV